MTRIYILLPVHNRVHITRRFIDCLAAQTHHDYHLLLIDDGSSDGTEEMVRTRIGRLTVIRGSGRWWWAGSLHQAYLWLKRRTDVGPEDMALIINDDTEFGADFLENGIEALTGRRKTLLLAQCYSQERGCLVDAGTRVDWKRLSFGNASSPEQIDCLSTRGLFTRALDFIELGGFHPRLLPHYLSDYEFTIRAHRRGYRLVTTPSVRLSLKESETGRRGISATTPVQYLRAYFSRKSTSNPLAWTSFVLLACPWPWKLYHIFTVWKNCASQLLGAWLLLLHPKK